MKQETYEEAVAYTLEIPKFTKKNNPEHTKAILHALSHGKQSARVIHVAGTNGKGSVCMFLEGLLQACGMTTGVFTSPHLVCIRERFRMNGEMISKEQFLDAFLQVRETVKEFEAKGYPHPSFFEFMTFMAMVLFEQEKVDYIVLETGLGGRLDATNSVEYKDACVITSIGLDHMEILGDSIATIAREKAGIIKEGVPVIYSAKEEEAARVIGEYAKTKGALGIPVKSGKYEILRNTYKTIDFLWNVKYDEAIPCTLHSMGEYQVENAVLALETIQVLGQQGKLPLDDKSLPASFGETLEQAFWPARMEMIGPGVLIDGAHNEAGIRAFAQAIKKVEHKGPLILLFSAVKEKNYDKMFQILCSEVDFDELILTEIQGERNLSVEELADHAHCYTQKTIRREPDIQSAVRLGMKEKQDGLLCCIGSLYLAGEIKQQVGGYKND